MMRYCLAAIIITVAWNGNRAAGAPVFLATQGSTLHRFGISGPVQNFPLSDVISGMTTVPVGLTVGNVNGGASGGDVLALGVNDIYRVDDPLGSPTLTPIGSRGGPNASPVFVGGKLYGIGGDLPDGCYLVEWRLSDFFELSRTATGVFGGPGGLAHTGVDSFGDDVFIYSEFNTSMLWEYTVGDTSSTALGSLPVHHYSGFEFHGGTLYATFALPTTNEMVFGTLNPSNGAFNQLRVYDSYILGGSNGITGLVVIPEPSAMLLILCGVLPVGMRRRT